MTRKKDGKKAELARTLSSLGKGLRHVAQPWTRGTEVMEIRRAVIEEAEAQIQPLGSGKYIFPFNRGRLVLLAKKPVERAVFEASLAGDWNPEREIAAHLAARGCPVPGLALSIEIVDKSRREFAGRRFFLQLERGAVAARKETRPTLVLNVLAGKARHTVNTFRAEKRIHLGRQGEVLDDHGRPKRSNDVVFEDDGGEINLSVSREHARIDYDPESGGFRLIDERSAHGTQIFRGGKAIQVSSRDRTGLRLQDGDEISLGRARLEVRIRAATE